MSEQHTSNRNQREFLFVFSTDEKKYSIRSSDALNERASIDSTAEETRAVRQQLIAELRNFGC
jgi:hypothetical protein